MTVFYIKAIQNVYFGFWHFMHGPTLCMMQWSVHPLQEGGVSGFLHAFIAEVFAMVRAHVAALGGNAVVSYIMKQCVFMENPSKNQVRWLNISKEVRNNPLACHIHSLLKELLFRTLTVDVKAYLNDFIIHTVIITQALLHSWRD